MMGSSLSTTITISTSWQTFSTAVPSYATLPIISGPMAQSFQRRQLVSLIKNMTHLKSYNSSAHNVNDKKRTKHILVAPRSTSTPLTAFKAIKKQSFDNLTIEELLDINNFDSHDLGKVEPKETQGLEDNYFALTPAIQIVFYIVYSLIFIVAVTGNSLVLYIVARNPSMQTPTNLFITNLAVSDLIMNFLAVPFTPLSSFLDSWIFGRALCHLVPMVQGCSVYVSTLTLTAIALDRYQVMFNPFETKKTKPKCMAIILGIWCLSITLVAPLAIFMKLKPSEDGKYLHCVESWPIEKLERVYSFLTLLLQYFVPLCFIAYCYVRVSAKITERVTQKTRTFTVLNRSREKEELRRKDRTNRMLIAMVAVFAFCWLPLNLIHVVNGLRLNRVIYWKYFLLLFFICHVIAMSSTCNNPMIYAWMNENFRKEFKAVLPCFRRSRERLSQFHAGIPKIKKPKANKATSKASKDGKDSKVNFGLVRGEDDLAPEGTGDEGSDSQRDRTSTFRCALNSVSSKLPEMKEVAKIIYPNKRLAGVINSFREFCDRRENEQDDKYIAINDACTTSSNWVDNSATGRMTESTLLELKPLNSTTQDDSRLNRIKQKSSLFIRSPLKFSKNLGVNLSGKSIDTKNIKQSEISTSSDFKNSGGNTDVLMNNNKIFLASSTKPSQSKDLTNKNHVSNYLSPNSKSTTKIPQPKVKNNDTITNNKAMKLIIANPQAQASSNHSNGSSPDQTLKNCFQTGQDNHTNSIKSNNSPNGNELHDNKLKILDQSSHRNLTGATINGVGPLNNKNSFSDPRLSNTLSARNNVDQYKPTSYALSEDFIYPQMMVPRSSSQSRYHGQVIYSDYQII